MSNKPIFRIVVLDCPIRTWSEERTRKLFERMVALKLKGYGQIYPENWMPLDKADFYATHFLVCDESSGELLPVAGFKFITLERAEFYHDEFVPLAVMKDSNDDVAKARLFSLIENAKKSGFGIAYSGSWTADPSLRVDKQLGRELKELVFAGLMYLPESLNMSRWLGFGTPKTKTDAWFQSMGMEAISGMFHHVSHDVVLLLGGRYTAEADAIAKRFRQLWDDRVVIQGAPKAETVIPFKQAA